MEIVVADAAVPGRVNEFDFVAYYFRNHADVANPATACAVAFEENEVAGLGFGSVNSMAYIALSSTRMR